MLKDIKHISFDAWNTLFVPSKRFANARAWAILRAVDSGHLTTVTTKYSGVKKVLDTLAEVEGVSFNVETNWKLLASQFKKPISGQELIDLRIQVENLFLQYPPEVPALLVEAIHELKKRGYTISVLSNTNFISGNVLRELYTQVFGEPRFFHFAMHSDQYGLAKPSMPWYGQMIGNARQLRPELQPNHILHIGDNEITDYQGALNVGIKALKIDNPHHLATLLQEALK